jgi:hypothetical protein
MTRAYSIRIVIAVALAAGLGPTPARAGESNEYKIKAALIFKFIQFVEWPKEAGPAAGQNSIVVATLGKDPFEGALEQVMAGKVVDGKAVVVRHYAAAGDVEKCQVLFAGAQGEGELAKVLKRQEPVGLLTVGETEQVFSAGGVIRIFEQENMLRFEISRDAAARARLRISAKLLRLAKLR